MSNTDSVSLQFDSSTHHQRKTSPVMVLVQTVLLFRSEQYFGSPSDAAAAEGVRERLLLVEERRLQLQEARLHGDDVEECLRGQESRLDVIGEELSEKEDQEDEQEAERHEDDELERQTQDC